jgi:hypothetical protein
MGRRTFFGRKLEELHGNLLGENENFIETDSAELSVEVIEIQNKATFQNLLLFYLFQRIILRTC